MLESIVFIVTLISFLVPIIFTTIKPFPFQIKSTESARRRGWNNFIIIITRTCPYLTLYTQFWTLLALYYLTPLTMYIARSMSWCVFFLYHTFNAYDPTYLTYHPVEFVQEVVSWKPPMTKNIIVWVGLHWQHTVFPFYLQYLSNKYNVLNEYNYEIYLFIIIVFYFIWHLFCWHVQGIAAYPFMNDLSSVEHFIFYSFCIVFIYIIQLIVN